MLVERTKNSIYVAALVLLHVTTHHYLAQRSAAPKGVSAPKATSSQAVLQGASN